MVIVVRVCEGGKHKNSVKEGVLVTINWIGLIYLCMYEITEIKWDTTGPSFIVIDTRLSISIVSYVYAYMHICVWYR